MQMTNCILFSLCFLGLQITFSRFTLGRFHSFTGSMGCQDGEMQISESERPVTGGGWCGSAIKPTHYFSESSSVKVTIKLHKLPEDNDDYNYDIKIIYRMLPRKDSVIRYGGWYFGKCSLKLFHEVGV